MEVSCSPPYKFPSGQKSLSSNTNRDTRGRGHWPQKKLAPTLAPLNTKLLLLNDKTHVEQFRAHHNLLLRILFVDPSKQPFFEKSAINDTSFEWTGVDKNRQNQHRGAKLGSFSTNQQLPIDCLTKVIWRQVHVIFVDCLDCVAKKRSDNYHISSVFGTLALLPRIHDLWQQKVDLLQVYWKFARIAHAA